MAKQPTIEVCRSFSQKVGHPKNRYCKTCQKLGEFYNRQSECKKCVIKKRKKYYAENKEKVIARVGRYYQKNKDKIRAYKRKWWKEDYAKNGGKYSVRAQRYREENRDKVLGWLHNYRAKVVINGGSHTQQEWEAALEKLNHACAKCGSTQRIEKDHIVPVSRGGANNINNLQPLCRNCNAQKNDRTIDYAFDKIMFADMFEAELKDKHRFLSSYV
jgi:5-methylcytosine-specific restriction endonuclease McrA